jgi:hypothetical protein
MFYKNIKTINFYPANMNRKINIHSEAKSCSTTIIGYITYGDKIEIHAKSKLDWYQIKCNNIVGFIIIKYCDTPKIPDNDTMYISSNNKKSLIDELLDNSETDKNQNQPINKFLLDMTNKKLQQLCLSIPKKINGVIVDKYISGCGTKDKLVNKIIKSGYTYQDIKKLIYKFSEYEYIYTCKCDSVFLGYTSGDNSVCELCKNTNIVLKENVFFYREYID